MLKGLISSSGKKGSFPFGVSSDLLLVFSRLLITEPALVESFALEGPEIPGGVFPLGGLELGLLFGAELLSDDEFPLLGFRVLVLGFDGGGLGLDGAGLGFEGGGFRLGPSFPNPHSLVAMSHTNPPVHPKRSQFELLGKHKPIFGPSVKQPSTDEEQLPTLSQFLSMSIHCP
jgi:hypothetical protein